MARVSAVMGAGGESTPDDPLYPFTGGNPKALLNVAGKPMAQWVLDALAASSRIDRVVVMGLAPDSGLTCGDKPIHFMPSAGSLVDNAKAGMAKVLELNPSATHALWVSADIPTVRGEHVDWLVEAGLRANADFCYSVIERSVMEARFPESRRTYTPLKGVIVCGGDMNLLATKMAKEAHPLWDKIAAARKSPLKQASLVGWRLLLMLALRQLTPADAVDMVGRRLGFKGQVLFCKYAEVGMDVDKPAQLELVTRDLQRRP